MGKAYFGSDLLASDSYIVFRASSQPKITTYPRTVGGIIQESGVVKKSIALRSFQIFPDGTTRTDVEEYFHLLNERINNREDTLTIHGNTYPYANVSDNDFDFFITKKFVKFTINFELNNQDSGVVRQLPCPGLVNFSRGRKMRFVSLSDWGAAQTFHFWHNFDLTKNLNVSLSFRNPSRESRSKVERAGGFEKITCHGWIIGPEIENRRNIEAYFYNIVNGPLGRLGDLYIDGGQVINNCILTDFTMEDTVRFSLHYELTFLASLQC
jgi:hypothetical protein